MNAIRLKLPSLSIFFPAYNEAGNIAEAVQQALRIAPTVADTFEIIVVNDGSSDATLQIAKRLSAQYDSVRVVSQRNKGYGGALKRGFAEARYEWIFFTDSDLQFNIAELQKFIARTVNNDLVIGYRQNRAEGWTRQLLAFLLKIWNRVLLGFPRKIKDVDCAFKLINRSVIKTIEPLFSDGAMISTEMLLKAHLNGLRYAQIGVKHYTRVHGAPTGSQIKVILKAVVDTFKLQKSLLQQGVQSHSPLLSFKHSSSTHSVKK